jgi:hypothetical protein
MKNRILFLMLIGFLMSCSKINNVNINGRFTHQINNCDNEGNNEINCTEFIEFIDDSTVNILIGGGDIVFRTNYQTNDNKIILEQTDFLNANISFNIKNKTTLNRIENSEVWEKE